MAAGKLINQYHIGVDRWKSIADCGQAVSYVALYGPTSACTDTHPNVTVDVYTTAAQACLEH